MLLEEEREVLRAELRERADVAADGPLEDEPLFVLQPKGPILAVAQ